MKKREFNKKISDVHDATGIPRNGSGQKLIRNPLREGKIGIEGKDWIKNGTHERAAYALTEEFFERLVKYLKKNK